MAELCFRYGPMGSQKSTRLLADAFNVEEHGGMVLLTKPDVDTKGDLDIVSRAGWQREVDFLATKALDVEAEVLERQATSRKKVNALLVDEAQFLEPRQVDDLLKLAIIHSIPVTAYGLRTDFRTRLFPGSQRLLEVAHTFRESTTRCGNGDGCETPARFNARLVDGVYVSEGSQVAIDGEGDVTYRSLCDGHFLKNVGPIKADHPTEQEAPQMWSLPFGG